MEDARGLVVGTDVVKHWDVVNVGLRHDDWFGLRGWREVCRGGEGTAEARRCGGFLVTEVRGERQRS